MSYESGLKWKSRRSKRYLRTFLETYSPEYNWRFPHGLLIQQRLEMALEQAIRGETVRLMFFMPPRHGKSSLITERFPAYCLHKRPYWKVMLAAFNETKATDFARRVRRMTKQSGIRISDERSAAGEWETVHGGGCKAAGVQTGAPGYGANLLIIDDPVRNRGDANSPVISDKIYDEFSDSFMSRLHKINMVIIVLTRWSDLDLAGKLLEDDRAGWDVINVPALALEGDILGRKVGEALCPDLIPLERLEWFRDRRPKTFESLYQGNPSLASGNIFQRDWFQWYDKRPDNVIKTVFSVDTAFKEKQENDPTCIGKWLQTETAGYLDDVLVERMGYPKLRETLISLAERDNPDLVLIEDRASGISLIQDLQNNTRLPIVPVSANVSKTARAHQSTGQYESGNIYHRRAEWLPAFEKELLSFPNGTNDDQVDMTTHFINNAMKEVDDFIIV